MNPDDQRSEQTEEENNESLSANFRLSSESEQNLVNPGLSQLVKRPRSVSALTSNVTASIEPLFEVSVPAADSASGEVIPRKMPPRNSIELNGSEKAQELATPRASLKRLDVQPSPLLSVIGFERNRYSSSMSSSPTTESLSWCGKGHTVEIGPYKLNDAMVYTHSGRTDPEEPSCIDLRKRVRRPVLESRGSLGYFPSYNRLTADQRANYLQWLASGRTGPLDDIGYAFLFFYGLERRFLVEGQDLSPIVKETVRLLELYDFSGSFDAYLSRFLSYSLAKSQIGSLKEKWFQAVFEKTRAQRDEQHLVVGLAWFYSQKRPLPVHWAMRIARLDPRAPRSVVLDRLPEQFQTLFAKRYAEEFGEGLLLKSAKREREIVYRPANPSLLDHANSLERLAPVLVPNVLGIHSQFSTLIQIWTSCIEDLKPLSRVIARGDEVSTRAAYEALPDNLKAEIEHPDKALWEKLASELANEDGTVLVPISALAKIQGIEERPKLTAKQSVSIASTAYSVGFVMEPDFRITSQPYKWEDWISLFRPEEPTALPTDGRYVGAALMLELGMYVAAADGEIEGEEVDNIASFLESQFLLDPQDVRRLEALKQVFLKQSPQFTGIGKRLKSSLNPAQLESVGEFLVGVAAANGSIDKKEVSALRSAYRAMGIDFKNLERLLEEYRRRASEPIEVQAGTVSTEAGEMIPARKATRPQAIFKLDPALLERLMQETRQVATLLEEAMLEEDQDSDDLVKNVERTKKVVSEVAPTFQPTKQFHGLDARHSALLEDLRASSLWQRSDFEKLVRSHSLMPSGAMDRINEWAHDCLTDPILEEDGDQLVVHVELLSEEV